MLSTLRTGTPYPLPYNSCEGAAAQFFAGNGNLLQLSLPSPLHSELIDLKKGKAFAGIVRDNSQISIYFKLGSMVLECPFSPHKIPKDILNIPKLDSPEQRLAVEMHVIDTDRGTTAALRLFTLPPALSRILIDNTNEILLASYLPPSADAFDINFTLPAMHRCGA